MPEESDNLSHEQIRAFVGPNAEYYLERWHGIGSQAFPSPGFNWAAGLFGVSWLLYRRMYRTFWIAAGVLLAEGMIEELASHVAAVHGAKGVTIILAIVGKISPLVVMVVFGQCGTNWYYHHTRRRIGRLAPADQGNAATLALLGGTNVWGAVVCNVVVVGVILLGAIYSHESPPPHQAKYVLSRTARTAATHAELRRRPDPPPRAIT